MLGLFERCPWSGTPESERNLAVLFPGQGTQKVGMATTLLRSAAGKAMFDTASEVLGYDLAALCEGGPQERLDSTIYSQPAIFVTSLAATKQASAAQHTHNQRSVPVAARSCAGVARAARPARERAGGGGLLPRRVHRTGAPSESRTRSLLSHAVLDASGARLADGPQPARRHRCTSPQVFGGALSLEDGLRLVKIRAEAMEAASARRVVRTA
jgi:hypothetical protein